MGVTEIEWCDYTFNPWIGCSKVSPGCKHCYASVNTFVRAKRAHGLELWGADANRHVISEAKWREVRKWEALALETGERRRVFCASMADVFEDHPEANNTRPRLWDLIAQTPMLDWLLLTKRIENVRRMVPWKWLDDLYGGWPANVWIGCTVEDQERAEERIPVLKAIPARVRFLSCEPLLEHIDFELSGLQWVIIGGESGHGARPFGLSWARSLASACRRAGAAAFVKQLGAAPMYCPGGGHDCPPACNCGRPHFCVDGCCRLRLKDAKGGDMAEWPEDLRVREFPEVRP